MEELRRNEFSLNYDIESVVTLELDKESIEIFTVMSQNRRHHLESMANKMTHKKGAKNDRASVYSSATTTTQGTGVQIQGNTELLKIQPILKGKMPRWINQAADYGGPVPVHNMISWAPNHEGDSRTVTSMSFAVSDGRTSSMIDTSGSVSKKTSMADFGEFKETIANCEEAERQATDQENENGTTIRSMFSKFCASLKPF